MAYCEEVRKLEEKFFGLKFVHILCGRNEAADELAKLGSSQTAVPSGVFLQELYKPTNWKKQAMTNTVSVDAQSIENGDEPESTMVMVIDSDWKNRSQIT